MGNLLHSNRRVLVLDDVTERRSALSARLEDQGFAVTGGKDVRALVRALDDEVPSVVLYDVSTPRTWHEVTQENALLRSLVAGRCPIVLYGDRPPTEFSELHWACQSAAHVPTNAGFEPLFALLRRLLPADEDLSTPAPSRVQARTSALDLELTKLRLLLIDDSELTLEVMQSRLVAVGFDVRIAVALGEVRSIVANWAPNVIVADVKRPDIRGDELCARLKATVRRADVLVVLCSSLPDAELRELARAARADGYVSKSGGLENFVQGLCAIGRKLLVPASSERASARGA